MPQDKGYRKKSKLRRTIPRLKSKISRPFPRRKSKLSRGKPKRGMPHRINPMIRRRKRK